jgi:hypothetical protein
LVITQFIEYKHVDYLTALMTELNDPGKGHLDLYINPFIRQAIERKQSVSALKSLRGLGEAKTPKNKPKQDLGGR